MFEDKMFEVPYFIISCKNIRTYRTTILVRVFVKLVTPVGLFSFQDYKKSVLLRSVLFTLFKLLHLNPTIPLF